MLTKALFLVLVTGTLAKKPGQVWLGSAPICTPTKDACDVLGMKYVESNRFGDSWWPCISGVKVLCELPGKPLGPPEDPKPQTPLKLQVIGLEFDENVLEGENIDQYKRKVHIEKLEYNGYKERSCQLPYNLMQKYKDLDIISLTGMHVPGCISGMTVEDIFDYYGWQKAVSKVSGYDYLGMEFYTRWPIISHEFRYFLHLHDYNDQFSFGYQVVELKKGQYNIIVISARFDNTDKEVRDEQIKEVIEETKKHHPHTVIVHSNYEIRLDKSSIESNYFNPILGALKPKESQIDTHPLRSQKERRFCKNADSLTTWQKIFDKNCEVAVDYKDLIGNAILIGDFYY